MEQRKRQGGLRVDPAVAAFQRKAATNAAALSGKQKRDRKRVRVKYDLDPAIKAAVEQIAGVEHEDTSASQVAQVLLAYGVRAYFQERALRDAFYENHWEARTPRFTWNVDVPNEWIEEIKNVKREA
jgi:hypothetical protein